MTIDNKELDKELRNYGNQIIGDLKERFIFPPLDKGGNNIWLLAEILEVLEKYKNEDII